jgi:hypothetical protein
MAAERLEGADEGVTKPPERQTPSVVAEAGQRGFDHGADALLADQFREAHHDVRIRDLLSDADATGPVA